MSMKREIVLSSVIVGLLAVFLGVRTWKFFRQPIPPFESPRVALPEDPYKFSLKTFAVPNDIRVHLLEGNFTIVRHMKDIPNSCTTIFESSFLTHSGSHASPGEIKFANPGEAFQASDNIVDPDLPFRRLEFAGLGATRCFIYYQQGGKPSSFCLAVMDYANQKTVFVGEGEVRGPAKNLDDLRRMMLRRQFRDFPWLAVC